MWRAWRNASWSVQFKGSRLVGFSNRVSSLKFPKYRAQGRTVTESGVVGNHSVPQFVDVEVAS